MKLPEPQTRTYANLISEIEKGQIRIPQFQRDFVWSMQQSASILDSIIKGYPIGSFILWRTRERLRHVKEIGNQKFPDVDAGENIDFVLDGQQRLTSLYTCLKGLSIPRTNSNAIDDFSQIYIDLTADDRSQIVKTETGNLPEEDYISVQTLLRGELTVLANYPKIHHDRISAYKRQIESYQYSIILIKDAPIDVATEIFTRINVGGKSLTLFEIMVAKTYSDEHDFDLAQKYESLIDRLTPLNYETVSDATVLQTISLIIRKECKRQNILALEKQDFIERWKKAESAIEASVDFIRSSYRIPVSKLLPYNTLIAPFAYFFYHHPDKPTGEMAKRLQDFFWRCSLSSRYSSGVEGKLAQDIKRIDDILAGLPATYDWGLDLSPSFIRSNGWFNTGRSYIKAILCIFAHKQPKSFGDDAIVNISNDWLKQANSKNYHHFFPKSYLEKSGVDSLSINNIINITIVDDFLNKRQIGATPPSKYMKTFSEANPDIKTTMQSHLIGDLDEFGISENDYETFLSKRSLLISQEISKRIIPIALDEQGQLVNTNDYEETTTASE